MSILIKYGAWATQLLHMCYQTQFNHIMCERWSPTKLDKGERLTLMSKEEKGMKRKQDKT